MVIDSFQERLEQGARNLLIHCANCQPGDTLLIINELDDTGYYDPELGQAIQDTASHCGLHTQSISIPFDCEVNDPDEALNRTIAAADCTVFLTRLGDQIRFRPNNSKTTQVITYALDRQMLASPFGTTEYQAFDALKGLVNKTISHAHEIHVTCPAGTDFKGHPSTFEEKNGDTTLKRFPVSVFAPIPAQGFSGRIAQNGFLTGTGSQYYSPWSCELKETLFVEFEGTQIIGFDGVPRDIAAAKAHYQFVAQKYGIDTYFIHSWHAGIHPGCEYQQPASMNFERWNGSAFGNPRVLHFHTCGAYPPGEISLNLLDPTIRIDGVAVWEDGKLYPERMHGGVSLLKAYPNMRATFDDPATQVGQAACGNLSFG